MFAKICVLLLALVASVSAFAPRSRIAKSSSLAMKNEVQKIVGASLVGASLFLGSAARAEVDYEGIKYLGGGDKIDLNNANIRAYLKLPGLYPNIASKVRYLITFLLE